VKAATLALLQAEVEEIATEFAVDGFMFDYTRFVYGDEPAEEEARVAFNTWAGLALTQEQWFAQCLTDGGSHRDDFFTWRAEVHNRACW